MLLFCCMANMYCTVLYLLCTVLLQTNRGVKSPLDISMDTSRTVGTLGFTLTPSIKLCKSRLPRLPRNAFTTQGVLYCTLCKMWTPSDSPSLPSIKWCKSHLLRLPRKVFLTYYGVMYTHSALLNSPVHFQKAL